MTNTEIVRINLNLIKTCCSYQAQKYSVPKDLLDDLVQEVSLILLEYPNDKLDRINSENHMNAFITGILLRTCYSTNSQFYRQFRKFSSMTDDITAYEWKY